jgi:hypothetical protein
MDFRDRAEINGTPALRARARARARVRGRNIFNLINRFLANAPVSRENKLAPLSRQQISNGDCRCCR